MRNVAWLGALVAAVVLAACSCSGDDGGRSDAVGGSDVRHDAVAPDGAADVVADPGKPGDTAAPDAAHPADAKPADTAPDVPLVVDPKCQALKAGTNTDFDVDGKARTFQLNLPDNAAQGGPWPVVFNWHGFGDTAANMAGLLSYDVNGAYPFMLVTPEDLGALPPNGMDWWILKVTDKDPDVRLYDEILTCLDQRYGVDHDRVQCVGFSAGSIMCDLLGATRGDQLAAIVTFSGSYFSNPPNREALGNFASLVTWPDMAAGPTYAQLLVHGGAGDNYPLGVTTLQFNQNGERDVTYLTGLGHDVVHCNHGGGHTIPQAFMGGQIVAFLQAHPRGVAKTWADTGWPATAHMPAYCNMAPAL